MASSGVSGAAAPAADKFAAAHQAMLHVRGLQFDFPPMPTPPPPPHWLVVLGHWIRDALPVLKWFFWIGVAVAVVAILWMIVRELPFAGFARRRRAAPAQVDWRPDAETARALLDDADRLAREGRYGEAIHLILFRSIDDLAARRPGSVRKALTSRDIVQAAPLSDEGRRAFGRIAEAVERSFFGGRAASEGDFARCREAYESFAFSEGWR